jgi:hypothetical protein
MNANCLCGSVSLLAIASTMITAQVRRTPDTVLLKHWPAPLYWQPQTAQATAADPPPNPLVLVAMTPCRVVDTRASQGFPAPFGAPSLAGGASRTFPLPSSTFCSIPAAAQAYSLNITVVPSTATGFITAYPTGQPLPLAATLVWSQGSVTSNAAVVPGGTSASVDVYASSATDIVIDINGCKAVRPFVRQLADRLHRRRAVHASTDLVGQKKRRARPGPRLADHVVGRLQILERTVPGLDLLVDSMRSLHGSDRYLRAIRQPDRNGRKVRLAWLPIPEPVPFDHSPSGGRRTLLKLPGCCVAAETALERFDFPRAEPFRPK